MTGRFEIDADGTAIYVENEFPIIELAVELSDWLSEGFAAGCDFEFDSMSTPETGWMWIRNAGSGWRFGSVHQQRADMAVRSTSEVRAAVECFIREVKTQVAEKLGTDVAPYF